MSPTTENGTAQSAQDALASIFGGAGDAATPSQPASRQATVNDILGLFDSPAAPSTPSPASPAPQATTAQITSLFGSAPGAAPPQPAPQQPAPAPSTSYTAYQKNNVHITLTPQTSPARPGIVNILARFQVSGTNSASNVLFQAAVPRVSLESRCSFS